MSAFRWCATPPAILLGWNFRTVPRRGCERCKGSGYAGRLAIIEAMTVSDEIRKLIIARANNREMGKIAIGQGMRTLRMVALDRVRDGTSTLEQVLVMTSAH